MHALNSSQFNVVASDLDGTLLAPDHQLSDVSKKTLKELHSKGFTFVFATGRHHVDVARIREQAGIPAFMITSNGARVHNQDDELMYSKNIDEKLVQAIVDIIKVDPKIRIHIYQNDQWLISQEDEKIKQFHKDSNFQYTIFDVNNAPTLGIAKLFFVYPDHEHLVQFENELNQRYGDNISVAFSTPWCLEVMAEDVSKGSALQAVAESIGSSLTKCIAFGDGMNDVEMLTMAGKGLVMGTSHEKVKKALQNNEVIGSNKEHAVARYLSEHLL